MTDAAPFAPRLDILTPPQRRLWDELGDVPETFTLYGGTGLALHLGHRQSVDFDFFGTEEFDPDELLNTLPFAADAEVVDRRANVLTVRADRGGPALASFFAAPEIGRVRPAVPADPGVKVADRLDIAGTKVSVMQKRAEVKDYRDLAALLRSGITLPEALAAGYVLYGRQFVPEISLRAISFFEDGDVRLLSTEDRAVLSAALAAVDLKELPDLSPIRLREHA